MASPLHRHQSSLEGVMEFSIPRPIEQQQRARAIDIFVQIMAYYEPSQTNNGRYNRISLIRLTFENATSPESFLCHFFQHIEQEEVPFQALSQFDNFANWNLEQKNGLLKRLTDFADYLIDNFFLPLKASAKKTPQPTPTPLSESQTSQPTGTTQRLSTLRRDCLDRDCHRCVISRKFDAREARQRIKRDGDNATDDDGNLLKNEANPLAYLEVAHILPHSLMSLGAQMELSDSKKTALAILDMFDPGVVHSIEGPNIDRSINALTLTSDFHQQFGDFEIYFEPDVGSQTQHTYKIDSILSSSVLRDPIFPVTRTLSLSLNRTIDPPSARLLAIHLAIGRILHLSGAGDYIERLLRDVDDVHIEEDGSTRLGYLVGLKLGDWFDRVPVY